MFDVKVMDEPVYTDRHSPACSCAQRACIIKRQEEETRTDVSDSVVWSTGHDIRQMDIV